MAQTITLPPRADNFSDAVINNLTSAERALISLLLSRHIEHHKTIQDGKQLTDKSMLLDFSRFHVELATGIQRRMFNDTFQDQEDIIRAFADWQEMAGGA